ncbi:MAG: DUF4920 domain-containing protein [Saprospiraceae bacterium]
MKTFNLLLSVCCFSLLLSCNEANKAVEDAAAMGDAAVEAAAGVAGSITDAFDTEPVAGANYGEGVAADAAVVPYPAFLTALAERDSLTAAVSGEVTEVCQKKGCWMSMKSDVADGAEMTVRFKDYGFFMPKELSGSKVIVEGTAKRVVVSVADLQHYAEDAGKTAAEIAMITEPEEELEFIATGVRVL